MSTYCRLHSPLSLSLFLTLQLRGGTAHASPEVIISQHISQTGLIFCLFSNCTCIQPSRGCSLSLFYSTTDRKTIDECTSDVTPDPRGTERDLKRRISILSLKKKTPKKDRDVQKGKWLMMLTFMLHFISFSSFSSN